MNDCLKWLFALSLILFSETSFSDQKIVQKASLVFDAVSPGALSKLVLGDLAGVSFVIDPEVMADMSGITVKMDVSKSSSVEWLSSVLAPRGYELRVDQFGGYRVSKAKSKVETAEDMLIYRPRFRSMAYIVDLVKAFFPAGKWSFERSVTPSSANQGAPNTTASEQIKTGTAAVGTMFSRTDLDIFVYEGSKADCKRLRELLDQVDTKPAQVVIHAALYEVSKISKDSSAFSVAADILGGRLGINIGTGSTVGPWSGSISVGGFRAVFSALSSDTRFKSLARPEIRLASGAQGRISVGDETPILGAITTQAGGAVTQAVEYRPSGHILSVTPVILDKGVELTISQQSSSFVQTTTGVNQSPTLLKRELQTRVMVEPGSLVVLGGLQESRGGQDVSGPRWVPEWVKRQAREDNETELLLVLHVEMV